MSCIPENSVIETIPLSLLFMIMAAYALYVLVMGLMVTGNLAGEDSNATKVVYGFKSRPILELVLCYLCLSQQT